MSDPFHQYVVAALLGIVEGLTEFLPVSSTGHLIIAERFFTYQGHNKESFLIFIQLGAILAVTLLYFRKFTRLACFSSKEGFDGLQGLFKLFLCSLPALTIGFLLGGVIKQYLFGPVTVAVGLIFGAMLILYAESSRCAQKVSALEAVSYRQSFVIGCFQCLSLWPGMSRSGSTIVGAMLSGCSRMVATEFSFLAAVPVMCAAVGYDMLKAVGSFSAADILPFTIGFSVALISAALAVRVMVSFVANNSLRMFAWYRIALGCVILVIFS